jgi:hypothetical protein
VYRNIYLLVSNQVNIGLHAQTIESKRERETSFEAIWGLGNQLERNTSGVDERWHRSAHAVFHTIETYQMANSRGKS